MVSTRDRNGKGKRLHTAFSSESSLPKAKSLSAWKKGWAFFATSLNSSELCTFCACFSNA